MRKIILAVILVGSVVWLGAANLYRFGGHYMLRKSDHAQVMVAAPATPERTVRVLFVGNSFTFVNDLPAMLVNIAVSDPGNRTRLEVKAETYPDAHLRDLLDNTGALAWARAHHVDYVVLQEHSAWYDDPDHVDAIAADAGRWVIALRALNETPLLFEVWSDGDGSDTYTNRAYSTFGSNPDEDAQRAWTGTDQLARRLGIRVVPVGTTFQRARHLPGAPELLGPDHHHPSLAGTYLAALVFYRTFTGRTGGEAAYRPWGMAKGDARMLAQIAAE